MLRVGDRQGQVLDAHRTAGGRALLADLDETTLAQLYLRPNDLEPNEASEVADDSDPRLTADEFARFRDELTRVREAGVGLNVELSEDGVCAFGVVIHNGRRLDLGAVTVAVPVNRYEQHARGHIIGHIRRCVREIEIDVADIEP